MCIGVGSSETIREILDENFKQWFIGFTEGRIDKKKAFFVDLVILNSPKPGAMEFILNQDSSEVRVLYYIKKKLGFGTIKKHPKIDWMHQYRVRNKKSLFILIKLFNGNLQNVHSHGYFKDWLAMAYKLYGFQVDFLLPQKKPTLEDTWLCGFTDGVGFFKCSIETKIYPKLKKNYHKYPLCEHFLDKTKLYPKEKLTWYKYVKFEYFYFHRKANYFTPLVRELVCGLPNALWDDWWYIRGYALKINISKVNLLIDYFNKYPLQTKQKHEEFLLWCQAYEAVARRDYVSKEGLLGIRMFCVQIWGYKEGLYEGLV
jgi:hypothetical protein